ncbi:MAG: hypothetical protein CSA50_05350 [Gammaproteobacteria bacterium]|nr:MAG: hypothetical protein CSA50_05350 [Gammaproteobacteria bacterium]
MNRLPGAWMVIYCKTRRTFLFGKRGRKMRKPNLWNLFGGHLDTGESASECAIREMREEASITLPLSGATLWQSPEGLRPLGYIDCIREMHYFLMVTDTEFSPNLDSEHSAFAWFKFDKLPKKVNRPTEIAIATGLFVKAKSVVEDKLL